MCFRHQLYHANCKPSIASWFAHYLRTTGHAWMQLGNERPGVVSVPLAEMPAQQQLGRTVNRREHVAIPDLLLARVSGPHRRLVFAVDECPPLVEFDLFGGNVVESWREAAERTEVPLAAWIRDRLNKAAKREAPRG